MIRSVLKSNYCLRLVTAFDITASGIPPASDAKVIELTRPAQAAPLIVEKVVNLGQAAQFAALFFKAANARHPAQQCLLMPSLERV